MTIEEKMKHFQNLSLETASAQSKEVLNSYKNSLDEKFEAHKIEAASQAEETEKAKIAQVRFDAKKKLASEQMLIKKTLTQAQASVKSQVFNDVCKKINEYRQTSAYFDYLASQIKSLIHEYKNSEITIYIDPDDGKLLDRLITATNGNIQTSDKPFLGGTRTIVPSMNILIDNSFKTKLADEQDKFTITL